MPKPPKAQDGQGQGKGGGEQRPGTSSAPPRPGTALDKVFGAAGVGRVAGNETADKRPMTALEKEKLEKRRPVTAGVTIIGPDGRPKTANPFDLLAQEESGEVDWGGNRLAYPHRTGFRPVSHVGFAESMSQSLLPHAQSMSPCHVRCTVMSDTQKCFIRNAQCHFTDAHSLDRIIQEN